MKDTVRTLTPETEADEEIIRHLLHAVENDSTVSQRQLATNLNIALGSVNWYLKRCINKGLIKIRQAPLRRYFYYLTPEGFDEKSRLTASYLRHSFTLFRKGREESLKILSECAHKGWKNIALVGDSDLAEIFFLSSHEKNISIIAIVDPFSPHKQRAGVSITQTLQTLTPDAIVLTDMHNPTRAYETICKTFACQDAVLIPDLLSFKPQKGEKI